MIEVERKIPLTPVLLAYLAEHAIGSAIQTIDDTYFDTQIYTYTCQNIWLRQRGDFFELKKRIKGKDRTIDRYEEITDLPKISSILAIPVDGDFASALAHAEILPFAQFTTRRQTYRLSKLTVDVDRTDFGEFTYEIAEVEFLVDEEREIAQAEYQIDEFLKRFNLDLAPKPQAKLTAYLSHCRPNHFKALQKSGVIE